jgi:uncharacterized protein with PIN domain
MEDYTTQMEKFIENRNNKKCPFCEKDLSEATPETFRNTISWKEYTISGLCQKCQDNVFGKD